MKTVQLDASGDDLWDGSKLAHVKLTCLAAALASGCLKVMHLLQ